jgi:glucokinase
MMNKAACIAMDVGGTNIRLALITSDGSILLRSSSPCRISAGIDPFLHNLATTCNRLIRHAEQEGLRVVAAGAGVPGLLANDGTIISSVNLQPLNGFNLQQWLAHELSLPVTSVNDANAAAVAEKAYGAGRPFGSLLHFTLGTGVGSGLILNGELWTGSDGFAAEYGHATVEPTGYLCTCGNHGCLEQYASATAIVRQAKEKITEGMASSLADLPLDAITAAAVATAAGNGDSLASACFASAGRYLGIAIATAVNMLNLDAVIIGGGVAASFALLAPAIRSELDARAFAAAAARVKLLPGELGDNAGIMGAAAAAWKLVH